MNCFSVGRATGLPPGRCREAVRYARGRRTTPASPSRGGRHHGPSRARAPRTNHRWRAARVCCSGSRLFRLRHASACAPSMHLAWRLLRDARMHALQCNLNLFDVDAALALAAVEADQIHELEPIGLGQAHDLDTGGARPWRNEHRTQRRQAEVIGVRPVAFRRTGAAFPVTAAVAPAGGAAAAPEVSADPVSAALGDRVAATVAAVAGAFPYRTSLNSVNRRAARWVSSRCQHAVRADLHH